MDIKSAFDTIIQDRMLEIVSDLFDKVRHSFEALARVGIDSKTDWDIGS